MSNITLLYDTKAYYVLVLIVRTKAINYTNESNRPTYIQLIDILPKVFRHNSDIGALSGYFSI